MKKKILFIVNPISGTQKKKEIVEIVKKYLNHDKYDYEIRKTEYAGHATELTIQATQSGIDIVVAVGGDGTVNEVARSVIHTKTALAIIPRGSGNGLARHLHIPTNPQKAIEIINQGMIQNLDYGLINGFPFFCTCGVGFDAFVSHKFAEGNKRGFLSYAENTLREGIRYKPETYTIEDENGTVIEKAFLIACANASQYGNNAYIAPHASMKDGLMDIVIMKPFNTIIESPVVLLQMFTKMLSENPNVKTLQRRKIRIIREQEGAVHLDGEPLWMGKEIIVEMVCDQFNVVINPKDIEDRNNFWKNFTESLNEITKKMDGQRFVKSMNNSENLVRSSLNEFKKRVDTQLAVIPSSKFLPIKGKNKKSNKDTDHQLEKKEE